MASSACFANRPRRGWRAPPRRLRFADVGRILLLFILVPLVEFLLLGRISEALGFVNTIMLVVVTGIVGGWLAKLEGLRVLAQWQGALGEGRMPEEGVLGGVVLLLGAVLLITPGVLTDGFGLLMLLPATRRWFTEGVVRPWLARRVADGAVRVQTVREVNLGGIDPFDDPFERDEAAQQRHLSAGARVIEAEYEVSRVDD